MYRKLEHRLGQAETLNNMGSLLLRSGDPRRALEKRQSALRLAREVHSLLEEARALEGMAHCELELGRRDEAVPHLREAVSIYHRIGAAEASSASRRLAGVETGTADERP